MEHMNECHFGQNMGLGTLVHKIEIYHQSKFKLVVNHLIEGMYQHMFEYHFVPNN